MSDIGDKGAEPGADAGFVLFEVLVGAAILALAGTMILLIGNNILNGSQRELDRSMTLVNAESFGRELVLVGADNGAAVFPADDGRFTYVIGAASATAPDPVPNSLISVHIEAHPKSAPDQVALAIDLLVPKHGRPVSP